MTSPAPMPPQQRIRWRFPVTLIILALLAILALHHREWVESYLAAWGTVLVLALTALGLFLWFVFLSGLSPKLRYRTGLVLVVLFAAAAFTFKATTRVEGTVSGVGVPRFVWKWSPHTGQNINGLQDAIADAAHPVDLSKTAPTDFPQFLGPNRTNSIAGNHLERDWTSHPPKKLWSHPVGLGWGSFAVVGNWAITQEQRGTSECVVCYDIATGQARWEFSHPNTRFSEWQGGDGPRATPTIDHGRVYCMGATGLLDCLDGATGKAVWSRDVMADTESSVQGFGKSCSPLIVDDLVIVTGGHGASLVAYQKSDGSPAWTCGSETAAYASPMIATLAGVRQILTINSDSAAAHDVSDGKLLWRYPWPGSLPKVPSPVPLGDDRVLISCGYGIGAVVLQVRNDAGRLSVTRIWNNRYLKPKFSDVAIKDGYVYGLDDAVLTCLDLSTGKRQWRGENYGFGQLLLVDNLLLIQCEDGNVALVEATDSSFHELTRFQPLSSKTWNNPTLSGHRLLVRNDQQAACFELP